MKEVQIIAYAAGIIDGEGTITLTSLQSGKYRSPVVSVSSTTIEILNFMKIHFGGHISNCKTYKEHHKKSYSWKLCNDKAIEFLQSVYPFLLEPSKSYRANLILTQYKDVTKRNGKYTEQDIQQKLNFEYIFFHPSNT